jgi:hypothetical protein
MQTLTYQQQAMQAIEKMGLPELEQFIAQIIIMSARRRARLLTQAESELLLKINRGLSKEMQQRCNLLNTKRHAGTLTPEEHAELLQLNEQIEYMEAKCVGDLAELALLRKTTAPLLMCELGIRSPTYV